MTLTIAEKMTRRQSRKLLEKTNKAWRRFFTIYAQKYTTYAIIEKDVPMLQAQLREYVLEIGIEDTYCVQRAARKLAEEFGYTK